MSKRKERLTRARFRIGSAQVHPDRLTIAIDGEEHLVEPRIMDVLIVLAENAGETLGPEAILLEVWSHTHFGDNPVHKAINALRKTLGDDPRSPKYIETIRKRGYRLIATVAFPDDYRRIPLQDRDWRGGNPYVGLEAFDSLHADVFHGRSRIIAECLASMRRQLEQQRRFVLLVGASGCGKTSLLNAGVIPRISQPGGFDDLEALSVAHCNLAGAQADDPVRALAGALAHWVIDDRPVFAPQSPTDLASWLRGRPERIGSAIGDAFRRAGSRAARSRPGTHLLLVIDHAETLVSGEACQPEDQARFERLVCALCETPGAFVIMVVRGDHYVSLIQAFPRIAELKGGDGHLDVLPPRPGEFAQIIRVPAAIAGLTFEEDESGNHLDDILRDAAIAQPDALPLLQHTLQALYERRDADGELRFSAYRNIGELAGALPHRAEDVLSSLSVEARESLPRVFAQMIALHPEHEGVSAQRVDREALDPDAFELVEAFVSARLFVADLHEGFPSFRVAHEALLRRWPRAREWAADNQRLLRARVRLQRAALRWQEEGRSDDHLLNRGGPMSEAVEVECKYPSRLSALDVEYIRASRRHSERRQRMRNVAVVALATLSLASAGLAAIAFEARNSAVDRRNDTLRLTDFMLSRLGSELRTRGDIKLLGVISSEALSVLQQKPIGEMTTEELVQHARSLSMIGEVSMQSGKIEEAIEAVDAAADAGRRAVELDPQSIAALNETAQVAFWQGEARRRHHRHDEAFDHWERYLRICDRLREAQPEESKWDLEKSYALNNIGTLLAELGKHEEAIRYFSESRGIKQKMLDARQDDDALRKDLLDTESWISSSHESLGRTGIAMNGYSREIDSVREVIRKNDENQTWKRWLANALIRRASLSVLLGKTAPASRDLNDSILLLEKLTSDNPDNVNWMRDLAVARMKASDVALETGSPNAAEMHIERALDILDSPAGKRDTTVEWRKLRALIRIRGRMLAAKDAETSGLVDIQVNALARLQSENPTDISLAEAVAAVLLDRAMLGRDARGSEDATTRSDAERAVSVIEPIIGRSSSPTLVSHWVAAHILLGRRHEVASSEAFLRRNGIDTYRMRSAIAVAGRKRQAFDGMESQERH